MEVEGRKRMKRMEGMKVDGELRGEGEGEGAGRWRGLWREK